MVAPIVRPCCNSPLGEPHKPECAHVTLAELRIWRDRGHPSLQGKDSFLEGLRKAHGILQRLYVQQGARLPSNVFMAMTNLHVEIVARTDDKEVA